MGPHADDFHGFYVIQYLVNQTMLDIYPSRACAGEITQKFLIWRGSLVGVFPENPNQMRCLRFQTGTCYFLGILLCLFGEYDFPGHQSTSSSHASTGVSSPSRIDSRMPGIDARNKVSWMARQSSSEIRTAEPLFPTIWMGSWDSRTSSTRQYKRFLASVAVKVGIFILLYVP